MLGSNRRVPDPVPGLRVDWQRFNGGWPVFSVCQAASGLQQVGDEPKGAAQW